MNFRGGFAGSHPSTVFTILLPLTAHAVAKSLLLYYYDFSVSGKEKY
jgi:hypothetical protein